MLKRKKLLIGTAISLIIITSLWFLVNSNYIWQQTPKIKVVLYKTPDCGCCSKYVVYLNKNGFDVDVKIEKDLTSIREKYDIPVNLQSCHTTIIDGYFVEGHVPTEVIAKLLTDKPTVDGIGLAAMPAGSPGMPGKKSEVFHIYSLINGQSSEFINL